jgi:hypothetical protein
MSKTRVLFFDLETRKLAKDLRPDDEDAGWDALRRGEGGISALVIYDTATQFCHCYDDHTIQAAARHLEMGQVVVTHTGIRFDVPVIEGVLGRNLRLPYHYDIYAEVSNVLLARGLTAGLGDMKLDRMARQNLGRGKINHGSHITELIKAGQWAKVFNYAADDVRLTRDLFAKMCADGGLISLNGQFLSLDIPEWIHGAVGITR